MSKIRDLVVRIRGDNKDLNKNVVETRGRINKLTDSLKKMGVALVGAFSVQKLGQFISKSTKAFDQQARAERALLTALKGRRNEQEQLIRQAQQLQSTTLFGDEETIKAQ